MTSLIDAALAIAAQHLWQGALLCGVAVALTRHRGLGAEWRSWLLLAVFVLAAIAPFAALLPPQAAPDRVAVEAPASFAASVTAVAGIDAGGSRRSVGQSDPLAALAAALALAWGAGIVCNVVRLWRDARRARRLIRAAVPAPALARLLGDLLPRGAVIATTSVEGPMLVGLRHPHILLPRVLVDTLAPEALRDVVLHEIAHLRRRDLWIAATQRLLFAVFWWSPWLRAIDTHLDLAREMACDARAAARSSGVDYADSLFASAERLFALNAMPAPLALGMAGHRGHLEQRIDLLIADAPPARASHRRGAAASVVLLAAFAGIAFAATPRVRTAAVKVPTAAAAARTDSLIEAVRRGDVAAVDSVLQDGADIDGAVSGRGTALMQAAWRNDLAMADLLLHRGANPDVGVAGEASPLIIAAALGHQDFVERLVQAGADVNLDVRHAGTPLRNAIRYGRVITANYLVEHGAGRDPDSIDDESPH